MAPLTLNDDVLTRKRPCHRGKIVRATPGKGKGYWDVQLFLEDGSPDGEPKSFNVRALKKPIDNAVETVTEQFVNLVVDRNNGNDDPPADDDSYVSIDQQNQQNGDDDADDDEESCPPSTVTTEDPSSSSSSPEPGWELLNDNDVVDEEDFVVVLNEDGSGVEEGDVLIETDNVYRVKRRAYLEEKKKHLEEVSPS